MDSFTKITNLEETSCLTSNAAYVDIIYVAIKLLNISVSI